MDSSAMRAPGASTCRAFGAVILAVSVLLLAPAGGAADGPAVRVALTPPDTIRSGDRTTIEAEVTFEPSTDLPILITPAGEGSAVEVVRGRLVRADAEDPEADVLRFRIPIVARTAGTGAVRVRAMGWVCEARCRQVTAEARVVMRVERAQP